MANEFVQTMADARFDAVSLSEFMYKPADFMVQRRLAPSINTLEYYLNLISETMNQAIINSGFVIIDSFELGATITQRNQALRHAATGNLYRWAGDLPKVVPASSTPLTSGGIGNNSWLVVSDLALADELKSTTGAGRVGIENKTVLDMLRPYAEHVFLESFRGIGFSDSQTINAALSYIKANLAGKTTRLVFQSNKEYVYDSSGDIRGMSKLIIDLNGSSLKRAAASTTKTTLAEAIGTGQGSFTVTAIPANWKVGDTLAAYSDNTHANITKLITVITNLNRTTNKVTTAAGLGATATWTSLIPNGATVAKKFFCFQGDGSDGATAAINTQIKIINGTIDGNSTQQENNSWYFINEINLNGNDCDVTDVTFKNTAGECIVGHGMDVSECRFNNLMGSAFHLSVHDDTAAQGSISRFRNNYVERVCLATNAVNGHSEGAITFSWGAGRLIVDDNEFKNGKESVLGAFGLDSTNADKWLVVTNNICEGFKYVFYSLSTSQEGVVLEDNVFSNCGNNYATLRTLIKDPNSSVGHNVWVGNSTAGGTQRIRQGILGTATDIYPSASAHLGSTVAGLDSSRLAGVAGLTKETGAFLAYGSSDTGTSGASFTTPNGTASGSFYAMWDASAKTYKLFGNIAGAKVHVTKAGLKLDASNAYTPVYADNNAAAAGGLSAGDVYRTEAGVLMVCW